MNAVAEGDMAILLTREVQAIGLWELRGIAVGRAEHRDDRLPGGDPLPTDLDVRARLPRRHLDGAVIAQDLGHRGRAHLGMLAQYR